MNAIDLRVVLVSGTVTEGLVRTMQQPPWNDLFAAWTYTADFLVEIFFKSHSWKRWATLHTMWALAGASAAGPTGTHKCSVPCGPVLRTMEAAGPPMPFQLSVRGRIEWWTPRTI